MKICSYLLEKRIRKHGDIDWNQVRLHSDLHTSSNKLEKIFNKYKRNKLPQNLTFRKQMRYIRKNWTELFGGTARISTESSTPETDAITVIHDDTSRPSPSGVLRNCGTVDHQKI